MNLRLAATTVAVSIASVSQADMVARTVSVWIAPEGGSSVGVFAVAAQGDALLNVYSRSPGEPPSISVESTSDVTPRPPPADSRRQ
jgi:hypothetical protein